ncbi:putative ABC transporter ATP-binding protein [Gemmatimonas aurantiaca T-27]|uniref:Putative ABC transporter ATP-binding protein n=1 Tax=Gemmatimonas aurantiaca (strain DSM 14586 / JCM 11422 / NBRC 100505 / T-27) TaxID=379066 RepID=C1A6W3_GEMAT|nr:putative ABC transporter ATP-binding protein [Gemmatimonas aurantiaca T-27]
MRNTLWRLLPYYHPYRLQVAVGLGAVVVAAALATLVPSFLQRGIDAIRDGNHLSEVITLGLVMLLTAVFSGSLRFVMRLLLNGLSRRIETDLRRDIYAHLTTLDPAWFARWRTGDLMARLTNDLSAVRMAAGPAVMYFANTVAGGLFALVMMLRISPLLTGAALLPMLGLPLLMLRLGKRVHDRFEAVQSLFSHLSTRAQENLSGVRVVRAYRQEASEIARFGTLGDGYLTANVRLAKLNGLMNPGFGLLAGLGGAVTIGVGGQLLIDGRITVGGFVAFGIYLAMLTWPLIALGWTTNLFQRGAASMTRVLELLDATPESVREASNVSASLTVGRGHAIEFREVWFHYPTATGHESTPRWVLRNINVSIPAGGTLAVVGATGSGKSALMDLLPRLFDAQRGQVLIDGVDVRDLPLATLRSVIGYVPQEALLFSETVGENIAYGRPDASREQLDAASEIAQLRETIEGLPEGYDTRLGERGINLSGGQKQRTALARALARHPGIVLLDDALSAVDTHTEAAILHGLRGALRGRTAIITSHRVSAVREADHIVVLHEGEIVEQGTHETLLELGGRYADLWQRQQLLDAIEAA